MNLVQLSNELFPNPEGTAILSIYKGNVTLSSDAEKILNIWFDNYMQFRYELLVDKDDTSKLFLKKVVEQKKWSNQIKRCFPACYLRYIFDQLKLDQNLKLVYKLTPKPLIIDGNEIYEFTLSRAVAVPEIKHTSVNVNTTIYNIQ